MRDFEVQTIDIGTPCDAAFTYISDPRTLPEWTHAFRSVSNGRATMVTPRGSVEVGLRVESSRAAGTIDWFMTFPDGSVGRAFSRLIGLGNRTLYSFVLMAPPLPLEQVEGALEEQARVLREELAALQRNLSNR
jgi:hypothetical protein